MLSLWYLLAALLLPSQAVLAIQLNINDPNSIRNAAATVAYSLQSIYNGNTTDGTLGKFPYPPFFWWESGAAWGGMVEYWHATGDNSYYKVTYDAMVAQISSTNNYLPLAEKYDEGNDDVAFWAFAAMSATEHAFREPPAPYPTWLVISDNIFNDYISRWHNASNTCGGGLKWQIFPSSAGYNYKNSISNGGFFQLAARLYRYTGNTTYLEWADKVWDWSSAIGLIDARNNYAVYDGSNELINCTGIDHHQWSYNVAIYLYGAAVLHNATASAAANKWTVRTTGLLAAASKFISPFPNATNVMYEQQCETTYSCNIDQLSFKAYLARWLAGTSVMMPATKGTVGRILRASAVGAASACTGNHCGVRWYLGTWDGTTGLGQCLSALEVITSLLVNGTSAPLTLRKKAA